MSPGTCSLTTEVIPPTYFRNNTTHTNGNSRLSGLCLKDWSESPNPPYNWALPLELEFSEQLPPGGGCIDFVIGSLVSGSK